MKGWRMNERMKDEWKDEGKMKGLYTDIDV